MRRDFTTNNWNSQRCGPAGRYPNDADLLAGIAAISSGHRSACGASTIMESGYPLESHLCRPCGYESLDLQELIGVRV